jgi:serine/threonine-protein kinase
MLEGLHYAHEVKALDGRPLHLVHRDVSPQNVFVTYDGQVKILDFGIAKAASSSTHTATGIMKGKIAYMAPEQMAGTVLDRRADIYSAGCMLWATAAGQKLWQDATDVQIVRAVVAGRIPSPRTANPDCPEALERIVMRALQADPDKRYSTAQELQYALEQFCDSEGLLSKQREVGRFVSDLFDDKRREFDENVEREYTAALAAEAVSLELESPSNHAAVTRNAETVSTLHPPAPKKKQRRLVFAGALLAVLFALGGSFLVMRDASAGKGESAAPPSAHPVDAAPPPTQALPKKTAATLKLAVVPKTATLSLDGKQLPANTQELTLPISDEQHKLVGEARDFETQSLVFKVTGDELLTLTLVSAPSSRGKRNVTHGSRAVAPTATNSVPTAAATAAKASCDNPFYVDAQGIKRVKPGCL